MKLEEFNAIVAFMNTAKGRKPSQGDLDKAREKQSGKLWDRIILTQAKLQQMINRLGCIEYHCQQYKLSGEHYKAARLVLIDGLNANSATLLVGIPNNMTVLSLAKRIRHKMELYDKWAEVAVKS